MAFVSFIFGHADDIDIHFVDLSLDSNMGVQKESKSRWSFDLKEALLVVSPIFGRFFFQRLGSWYWDYNERTATYGRPLHPKTARSQTSLTNNLSNFYTEIFLYFYFISKKSFRFIWANSLANNDPENLSFPYKIFFPEKTSQISINTHEIIE